MWRCRISQVTLGTEYLFRPVYARHARIPRLVSSTFVRVELYRVRPCVTSNLLYPARNPGSMVAWIMTCWT